MRNPLFMKRKFSALVLLLIFLTQLSPVVVKADEVENILEQTGDLVQPDEMQSETLQTDDTTSEVVVVETTQVTESVSNIESEDNESAAETFPEETESTESTQPEDSSPDEEENLNEEEMDVIFADDATNGDALKDFTGVVRQSKDYTCGPAALATLLTQLGEETTEEDVLEKISEVSELLGVSMLSLRDAALALGETAILKKWSAQNVLDYISSTGNPVLIHDEKENVGGHFSVIRKYDPETGIVTLSDTEAGNIEYSLESFETVFKGYVLIVSPDFDNELISDETTNLSDLEAASIYGKYVPVYIALGIDTDEATQKDIQTFKLCINKALLTQNKEQRDAKRETCYNNFSKALGGDGLSVLEESSLITSYNTFQFMDFHENSVGYKTLRETLEEILSNQKGYINAQKTVDSKLTKINIKSADLSKWLSKAKTLKKSLTEIPLNLTVLEEDNKKLNKVVEVLEKDLKDPTFTYKGKTLKLGDVKSQLSASSTTLKTLSSAIKAKLDSYENKITDKEKTLKNLNKDLDSKNKTKADYEKQIKTLSKSKKYTDLIKRVEYEKKLSSLKKSIDTVKKNISKAKSDIADLKEDRDNLSENVTELKKDIDELKVLKDLGEKEKNRKEELLENKKNELSLAIEQINYQKNILTNAEKTYKNDKNLYLALWDIDAAKTAMDTYSNKISTLAKQFGYSDITSTNTDVTEDYLAEELEFIKTNDEKVYEVAVEGTGDIASLIVSLIPVAGEGYDVITLLGGEDPVTKESLTPFTKVLTLIGLISGAGSGKAAREIGMEALEKLAGDMDVAVEDLLPLAEDVAKKYDVDSLEELWNLREKLSIDSFIKEVKTASRTAKALKVLDELKSAVDVPELIELAEDLKIPEASKGLGKFFIGTEDEAKQLFDELTEGWTEQIIDDGIKKITVRTSPDNLYSLNFRTFYTSTLMDTVERVDATIDVIEKGTSTNKIAEIKFGTLK